MAVERAEHVTVQLGGCAAHHVGLAAARGRAGTAGHPPDAQASLSERLAFALRGLVVGGAVLLAMIMFIAGARPLWKETIQGAPDAPQLELHVRVQRNTLEQLVVMALAHLALATVLPHAQLKLLPTLVALFVLARVAYWVGYTRDPMYRTFGFVATFYPNIYATGLALWWVFGGG